MNISYEEQQQECPPEMQKELARIKSDQVRIFEARNRIMNGGASKEQIFLAINAAATNMTIFRELYEKHVRIVAGLRRIQNRQDDIEERLGMTDSKKMPTRRATARAVPAANVIILPVKKRRKAATQQG